MLPQKNPGKGLPIERPGNGLEKRFFLLSNARLPHFVVSVNRYATHIWCLTQEAPMLQSRLSRAPDFGMYRWTDWGIERSMGLLSNGSAPGCGASAAVAIRSLDGSRHQRIDPKGL